MTSGIFINMPDLLNSSKREELLVAETTEFSRTDVAHSSIADAHFHTTDPALVAMVTMAGPSSLFSHLCCFDQAPSAIVLLIPAQEEAAN